MKLSILIPVYNERETLREILSQVRAVELAELEKEVIVVDDGSTDGSREILAAAGRKPTAPFCENNPHDCFELA